MYDCHLGGTDKDSRPRICDLKPGSIAHRYI